MATASSRQENPKVVSQAEWLAARKELLKKEKEFTKLRDELSAQRCELPWEKVEKQYAFDGQNGKETLADLFGGRSQLIVYHFMFGPGWKEGCPRCSFVSDHINASVVHLAARDVKLMVVSRAPLAEIEAFKKRMGWRFKWVSSFGSDFNYDYQVTLDESRGQVEYNYRSEPSLLGGDRSSEMPGYSCFLREGDEIFHTYSVYGRGTEYVGNAYTFLDMTALGRQEDWEEPKGRVPPVRGGDPTFTS